MYQKIIIAGNLGRDPELRYLSDGTGVCNLNVATNHQYTKNGATVKETTWFRVSVWGKQAESCNQYLRKGSKVLVEGRMTADNATGGPRVYESNGEKRASFEITAQTVCFLSSKGEDSAPEPQNTGAMLPPDDDSDLPF